MIEQPGEHSGVKSPARRRRGRGRIAAVDAALGARLRRERILRGLSQQALGALIGVTFQQVQKYERGDNRISVATLLKIAAVLKMTVAELLDGLDGAAAATEPSLARRELEIARGVGALPAHEGAAIARLVHALVRRTQAAG